MEAGCFDVQEKRAAKERRQVELQGCWHLR